MKRAIFCTCLLIVPMLTLGVGEISPFRALTSDGGGCDLRVVKRVSERERNETAEGVRLLKVSRADLQS